MSRDPLDSSRIQARSSFHGLALTRCEGPAKSDLNARLVASDCDEKCSGSFVSRCLIPFVYSKFVYELDYRPDTVIIATVDWQ